jgi:hypothetical protein
MLMLRSLLITIVAASLFSTLTEAGAVKGFLYDSRGNPYPSPDQVTIKVYKSGTNVTLNEHSADKLSHYYLPFAGPTTPPLAPGTTVRVEYWKRGGGGPFLTIDGLLGQAKDPPQPVHVIHPVVP